MLAASTQHCLPMSLRGETGWQAMHQKAFGKERWRGLYRALKEPVSHVAIVNQFLPAQAQARACEEHHLRQHASIPVAHEFAREDLAQQPAASMQLDDGDDDAAAAAAEAEVAQREALADVIASPLLPCYFLDGASAIAALALGVEPGHAVLDLCAAPGGKAVILASLLFSSPGPRAKEAPEAQSILVCNEPSRGRTQRLQRVLSSFLPAELLAPGGGVYVTSAEATTNSGAAPISIRRLGPFDRVLVDAPCSSDRHLARQGRGALAHWASGAVKANADRQLEILQCAAALVKPGGCILYCTCALAEQENDGVLAKFLKKAQNSFEAESLIGDTCGAGLLPPTAEPTAAGTFLLPDRCRYGPMYMARLRRV